MAVTTLTTTITIAPTPTASLAIDTFRPFTRILATTVQVAGIPVTGQLWPRGTRWGPPNG